MLVRNLPEGEPLRYDKEPDVLRVFQVRVTGCEKLCMVNRPEFRIRVAEDVENSTSFLAGKMCFFSELISYHLCHPLGSLA